MTRNLKVESDGDFFHGKVVPKIRLKGKWLERAGFPPGSRVVVTEISPGILILENRSPENLSSMSRNSTTAYTDKAEFRFS